MGYDWFLVDKDINDSQKKDDVKIDRLTKIRDKVGELIIKNPVMKSWHLLSDKDSFSWYFAYLLCYYVKI